MSHDDKESEPFPESTIKAHLVRLSQCNDPLDRELYRLVCHLLDRIPQLERELAEAKNVIRGYHELCGDGEIVAAQSAIAAPEFHCSAEPRCSSQCPSCEWADDPSAVACSECKGSGSVAAMTQHLGPDDYSYDVDCSACGGTGVLTQRPYIAPTYEEEGKALFEKNAAGFRNKINWPDLHPDTRQLWRDEAKKRTPVSAIAPAEWKPFATLLRDLLNKSVWPTSDPRWKIIEEWASQVERACTQPTEIKP